MVRAVEKIPTWFLALRGRSGAVGVTGLNENVGVGRELPGLLQAMLHEEAGEFLQQQQSGADGGAYCAGHFLQYGNTGPRTLPVA